MPGYDDDKLSRLAKKYGVSIPEPTPTPAANPSAPTVSELLAEMHGGTSKQESGGNTRAVNPHSSAIGQHQVMPANVRPWTRQYFGRELSPEEFKNNPQAQKAVFDGEMGKYIAKALPKANGDRTIAKRMASAAWYGGERNMHLYDDPRPQRYNGNKYPSFREYTSNVAGNPGTPAPAPTFDYNALSAKYFNSEPSFEESGFDRLAKKYGIQKEDSTTFGANPPIAASGITPEQIAAGNAFNAQDLPKELAAQLPQIGAGKIAPQPSPTFPAGSPAQAPVVRQPEPPAKIYPEQATLTNGKVLKKSEDLPGGAKYKDELGFVYIADDKGVRRENPVNNLLELPGADGKSVEYVQTDDQNGTAKLQTRVLNIRDNQTYLATPITGKDGKTSYSLRPENQPAQQRKIAPGQKIAPQMQAKTAQTAQKPIETKAQFNFERTGKLPLADGGGELSYQAENRTGLKEGEYRFTDATGNGFILNPSTDELRPEAMDVVEKVVIALQPQSAVNTPEMALQNQAETVANQIADKIGVPKEDIVDYYQRFGFTDLKTGNRLPNDRLFAQPRISGIAEDQTDFASITKADVEKFKAFSADKAAKKAEYEQAKSEFLSQTNNDDYLADLLAKQKTGLGDPAELEREIQIYGSQKTDFETQQAKYAAQYGESLTTEERRNQNKYAATRNAADVVKAYGSFAAREVERQKWQNLPFNEKAKETGIALARVLPNALAAIYKTAGAGESLISRFDKNYKPYATDKSFFYQLGDIAEEFRDTYLPQRPEARGQFITQAADSFGQVVSMAGAAWATGGIALGSTMGLSQGFASQYDEAKEAGATENERLFAASVGALAAAPDILITRGWFKFLTKTEKVGLLSGIARKAFIGISEKAGKDVADGAVRAGVKQMFRRAAALGTTHFEKEVIEQAEKLTLSGFAKTATKSGFVEGFQESPFEDTINETASRLTYGKTNDPKTGKALPNQGHVKSIGDAFKRVLVGSSGEGSSFTFNPESFVGGFVGGVTGGTIQAVTGHINARRYEKAVEAVNVALREQTITPQQHTAIVEAVRQTETEQKPAEGKKVAVEVPGKNNKVETKFGTVIKVKQREKKSDVVTVEFEDGSVRQVFAPKIVVQGVEGFLDENQTDINNDVKNTPLPQTADEVDNNALTSETEIAQSEVIEGKKPTEPIQVIESANRSNQDFTPVDEKFLVNPKDATRKNPKIWNASYSEADNREYTAQFKGKDGQTYIIKRDLSGNNGNNKFTVYNSNLDKIAGAVYDDSNKDYITGFQSNQSIQVDEAYRRKGIATAITDFAERQYGKPYKPSSTLSPEMTAFVSARTGNKVESQTGGKSIDENAEDIRLDETTEKVDNLSTSETSPGQKPLAAKEQTGEFPKSAVTPSGTRVNYRGKVIDESDILTSFDEGFPKDDLQPRNTDRKSSREKIVNNAANLDTTLMDDSPVAGDGAPKVYPVQINGQTKYIAVTRNHGVESIREANATYPEKAKEYADFARSKDAGTSAKNPVYVHEIDRASVTDLPKFAVDANVGAQRKMSDVEQAQTDAKLITSGLMEKFTPADDGSVNARVNADFIKGFLEKVVDRNEHGAMQTADSELSQTGVRRIKNAIFARAFGQSDAGLNALGKMAESTNDNVKNITNALLAKSGAFADLSQAIADGKRFPAFDITKDLVKAAEKFSEIKADSKNSVQLYLDQPAMFGRETTAFQDVVLIVFDEYARNSKAIRTIFDNYIAAANEFGDPNQQGLIGDLPDASAADTFAAAVKLYEEKNNAGQTGGLFDQTPAGEQNNQRSERREDNGNDAEASKPSRRAEIGREIDKYDRILSQATNAQTRRKATTIKMALENYPYPLKDESEKVDNAFQNFFDTVEEETNENGNVALKHIEPSQSYEQQIEKASDEVAKTTAIQLRSIPNSAMTTAEKTVRTKDVFNQLRNKPIYNKSGGFGITITHSGLQHNQTFSADIRKMVLLDSLKDVLENATVMRFEKPDPRKAKNRNIKGYVKLAIPVKFADGHTITVITLQKDNNGKVFYDAQVNDVDIRKMPVDDIEGREGINSNGLASIQQAYKNYTLDIFDVNKIDSSLITDENGNPITDAILKRTEATAAEFDAVKLAPASEIRDKAAVEVSGSQIKLNLEGQEFIRRIIEESDIKSGRKKLGDDTVEASFSGLFTDRFNSARIISQLRSLEKAANGQANTGTADLAKRFAEAFEAAAEAGRGTTVSYMYDNRLAHEQFHQNSYLGGTEDLRQRHANFAQLLNHPAAKAVRDYLLGLAEYRRLERSDSNGFDAVVVEETAAYIAGGEAAILGISEDAAADYLVEFFDSYAGKNGVDSLLNFAEHTGLIYDAIEKIKSRYAQTGAVETGRSGADSAQQPGQNQSAESSSNESVAGRSEPEAEPVRTEGGLTRRNSKLRALPATLREAGFDAEDLLYDVLSDDEAKTNAAELLGQLGISGAIDLIDTTVSPDATHANLGFMINQVLQAHSESINESDPEESKAIKLLQAEFSADLARKFTKAGQFISAARVVQNSVVAVVGAARAIAEARGKDAGLSNEQLLEFQTLGEQNQIITQKLNDARRKLRNEQARLKTLQNSIDGKTKRRTKNSRAARVEISQIVKKKHEANVNDLIASLKAELFGAAASTLKHIEGETLLASNLTPPYLESVSEIDNTKLIRQIKSVQENRDAGGRLLAPNGKPSKLNEYLWKLVRTEDFKNWFGDWENDPESASRVVDENGEPMPLYHGTSEKEFEPTFKSVNTAFKESFTSYYPIFLTNSESLAEMYIADASNYIELGGTDEDLGEVFPFFANKRLEDVLRFDANGQFTERMVVPYEIKKALDLDSSITNSNEIAENAAGEKYTVIIDNVLDNAPLGKGKKYRSTIVIFVGESDDLKPISSKSNSAGENVPANLYSKSAIGNTGEFSKDNDSILKRIEHENNLTELQFDQIAKVGAYYLTQGLANKTNEYTPDDFRDNMIAMFGDKIAAGIDDIHRAALNVRAKWLSDIAFEKRKTSLQNKADSNAGRAALETELGRRLDSEDLSDEDVYEILNTRRDVRRRRNAVEKMHSLVSGFTGRQATEKELEKFGTLTLDADTPLFTTNEIDQTIVEFAANENEAAAAKMLHDGFSKGQFLTRFKQLGFGLTDSLKLYASGVVLLQKVKAEVKANNHQFTEDAAAATALITDAQDEITRQRKVLRTKQREISSELEKLHRSKPRRVLAGATDILNSLRSLMASVDLSAGLRQGGYFSTARPELQKQAFSDMLSSFTELGYGRVIQTIENHPRFLQADRAGVEFAEAGSQADFSKEEVFKGVALLESIPFLGKLINKGITGWSERTYSAFLDSQRIVIYHALATELEGVEIDGKFLNIKDNPEQFEFIANFINIATGKGITPKGTLGKLIVEMPFFAPRYALSRFQLLNKTLNPVAYYNMPPGTRRIVAKSAGRFYGTIGILTGIAALLGASVSFDDDDTDFLKMKWGNTSYDIFAGTMQPAKMMIKILHSAIRTKLGQDNRVPKEFSNDLVNAGGRFLRGKLSPALSYTVDALMGEDYLGKPFSFGWGALARVTPLTLADISNSYELDGGIGVLKSLPPAFVGIGVQTFERRPESPKTEAEKLAAKMAGAMGGGNYKTLSAADQEKRTLVQKLTARSRKGEDVRKDVSDAEQKGLITPDQKTNIMAAAKKTLLEDKAEGLQVAQIEELLTYANDDEKKQLNKILSMKKANSAKKANSEAAKEAKENIIRRGIGGENVSGDLQSLDKDDRKAANKAINQAKSLGLKSDAAYQIKSATKPEDAIAAFEAAPDDEKQKLLKLLIVKKHKAKSAENKDKYDVFIIGYSTNNKNARPFGAQGSTTDNFVQTLGKRYKSKTDEIIDEAGKRFALKDNKFLTYYGQSENIEDRRNESDLTRKTREAQAKTASYRVQKELIENANDEETISEILANVPADIEKAILVLANKRLSIINASKRRKVK